MKKHVNYKCVDCLENYLSVVYIMSIYEFVRKFNFELHNMRTQNKILILGIILDKNLSIIKFYIAELYNFDTKLVFISRLICKQLLLYPRLYPLLIEFICS